MRTSIEQRMCALKDEEMAALDALLPLVIDDGPLHETRSLPPLVYQSPAHLDYVVSRLPGESIKGERLATIDRHLRVTHLPLAQIKRFRGGGGPHGKMMWWAEQIDPHARRVNGSVMKYAPTGDEASIKRTFNDLIRKCFDRARATSWWGGTNLDKHHGRFWPIPGDEEQFCEIKKSLRETLAKYGFTVEFVVVTGKRKRR